MKTLHHTETTWQGRKIIIDAADLTAECRTACRVTCGAMVTRAF